jgi:CubicO group peptidase (beta-lactamase class C family)
MAHDGPDRIWRAAERLYRTGLYPALSLCIRRKGEVVLDRSIGHARGFGLDGPGPPVVCEPTTPMCIFSASKAVTAMLIHLLDDRGVLHTGDRVSDYIPEFAANGKEWITIRHVLTHRAGLPNLAGNTNLDLLSDPQEVLARLCEAAPTSKPGRRLAYHALTGGFILAEVVRRVCGKPIREVLDEKILAPLAFEHMNYGVPEDQIGGVCRNAFTGRPPPRVMGYIAERALGVPFRDAATISNDRRWLTGVVPSGNIVATANELSRFYQLLLDGGTLDGVRIMEERTVRRARQETAYLEMDFTLMLPIRYGVGLMLGAEFVSPFGPDTPKAFGHHGFINIISWADPERELAVALLTSGKPAVANHFVPLVRLLRRISRDCPKVS